MSDLLVVFGVVFLLIGSSFWLGYKWSYSHLRPYIASAIEATYTDGFNDGKSQCEMRELYEGARHAR